MPSLDSPVLTLGALYVAGENRRGRRFTAGLNGRNLLAGGFGAASAEYLGQQTSDFLGVGDTITPQLAQALVGAGISRWGDVVPQNEAIAAGIHYNVAAQSFQDAGLDLQSLVEGVNLGGGSGSGFTPTRSSPSSTTTTTDMAATNGGSSGVTFG